MASPSSDAGLTKSKELGRYREGAGGGKPHQSGRTVARDEVGIARKCAGCDKQMNKAKVPLVCTCKKEIYCSKDCQESSRHNCRGTHEISFEHDYQKIVHKCYVRYQVEQNLNRGPSSEKIGKLMKRSEGDQEHILVLAEAGDPIAAYVVGEAYALRKDMGKGFRIPRKYLKRSYSETNEIGVKWLKIAGKGGVPEAMFLLAMKLDEDSNAIIDKRVAYQWLDEAYGTGKMDYLLELLESSWLGLPAELENSSSAAVGKENLIFTMISPTLAHLLLAARWEEIRNWNGKTATGEPFFGWVYFRKLMETLGSDLKKQDTRLSSLARAKNKDLIVEFVSGRPGCSAITSKTVPKERDENNTKFLQGVKPQYNPDYQIITEASQGGVFPPIKDRTIYLVSCKHNGCKESNMEECIKRSPTTATFGMLGEYSLDQFQVAGKCHHCSRDALQRLKAVATGLYSISINQIIPRYGYAARYVNEDGVIVQDIFKAYSKPDLRQVLQCLMSNPADLHPLAMAEDQNLFWPIVWYWGSVFHAVQDTCNRNALEAVYQRRGGHITLTGRSPNASSLAAFPESAAGEWRIACGSEDCPRVDHEVKFQLCKGCKVRRYCDEECQRNDWTKHKQFCRAAKLGSS